MNINMIAWSDPEPLVMGVEVLMLSPHALNILGKPLAFPTGKRFLSTGPVEYRQSVKLAKPIMHDVLPQLPWCQIVELTHPFLYPSAVRCR